MDPDTRLVRAARAAELSSGLDGIDIVALTFVDNAGITRCKGVPTSRLEHAAAWGVGMSTVFDTFLFDDTVTVGTNVGGPVGDLRLYPDLDALVRLAAQPGWAWAPVDRHTQDGAAYSGCQRGFARRMVERAAAAGVEVWMGFETEWAVGVANAVGGVESFQPAGVGPAYGMARMVELSDYCREIAHALAEQAVPVEQVHPEHAPGQFEVSVAPSDPVTAADRGVLVRETVRAVSQRHGLRVSFAPVVVTGLVGNGGHVHVSLHRDGRNLFTGGDGPHGLTREGESFLAGVLAHLPALCAVGAPSVVSYLRLVPSRWAGAFQAWGLENRETALRLITGSRGEQTVAANAEIKCFDQSANPYLVVGALLAAGLSTMEEGRWLPREVTGDPALLDRQTLAEKEITRLPQSSAQALAHLERDEVLREAFGADLFDAFTAVRRAEIDQSAGYSPDQIVAASRWRY